MVRFLMEERELEREEELLDGSVEGAPMSEKGVPEKKESHLNSAPEKRINCAIFETPTELECSSRYMILKLKVQIAFTASFHLNVCKLKRLTTYSYLPLTKD